jgi:hypothetical protein
MVVGMKAPPREEKGTIENPLHTMHATLNPLYAPKTLPEEGGQVASGPDNRCKMPYIKSLVHCLHLVVMLLLPVCIIASISEETLIAGHVILGSFVFIFVCYVQSTFLHTLYNLQSRKIKICTAITAILILSVISFASFRIVQNGEKDVNEKTQKKGFDFKPCRVFKNLPKGCPRSALIGTSRYGQLR